MVQEKGTTRGVIDSVTQRSGIERRETMAVLTGMRRESMWIKVFIVVFMVIAVTFAYSTYTYAMDKIINIKVKANDNSEKTIKIVVDGTDWKLKEAKIDGQDNTVTITGPLPLPITFKEVKGISEIRGGSVIVFDGSTCIPISDGKGGYYWIGYPPGTKCP